MKQKNFYKQFVFFFILFGLLISVVSAGISYYIHHSSQKSSLQKEADEIYKVKVDTYLKPFFYNLGSTVLNLANSKELHTYILDKNRSSKKDLELIFLWALNSNDKTIQARFIDQDGFERVRVDRTRDEAGYIVAEDSLQNKKQRYYFKEASKKAQQQLWYSRIDLNKENGEVEIPYRETIRIATPVHLEGKFRGIVILNLDVHQLLNSLSSSSNFVHYVIDKDKNFLVHPDSRYSLHKYKDLQRDFSIDFPKGLDDDFIYTYQLSSVIKNSDMPVLILKPKEEHLLENKRNEFEAGVLAFVVSFLLSLIVASILAKQPSALQEELAESYLEIQESHTFIESILNNESHMILTTDLNGIITLFNQKAQYFLGYKADEVIQKESLEIFHKKSQLKERAQEFSEELGRDIAVGFETLVAKTKTLIKNDDEWIFVDKEGREKLVKLNITKLSDSNAKVNGFLVIAEDVSYIKEKEKQVKDFMNLIDQNIITSSTDLHGIITYVSEAFSKISGFSKKELVGNDHNIVRHQETPLSTYHEMWNTITNDKVWHGEIKNRAKDGGFYWVEATIYPNYDFYGKKIGYTAIRKDITDKKHIEKISITDGLTQIYNRRHFDSLFPKIINSAKRENNLVSFVIMDIDHFKQYNDTYGHQKGDEVLIQVASCIYKSLHRADDYCFRLGGEEFGVVFKSDSKENALMFTESIRRRIEELGIEHSGNSASKYVTVSMGLICQEAVDMKDVDEIYKNGDALLYEAKRSGKNRVEHYFGV